MRLTLRTLLSYLDKVHLTGEEREAIQRQIAASENAGEWIHRTQDVMRRLKVGVPEIDGSGSADDPNSVAEYLDRTLPDESVAEFERVCLESEPLLAEVASCHHVLAMFLSEDAPIDPDTRNRLHRLQADLAAATRARIEPPPVPDLPAPPAPPEPPVEVPGRRSHVPGYLREAPSADWKRWAPAIAALVLLALTAGVAFLPGGPLNPRPEPQVVETTASTDEESATPIAPSSDAGAEPDPIDDEEPLVELAESEPSGQIGPMAGPAPIEDEPPVEPTDLASPPTDDPDGAAVEEPATAELSSEGTPPGEPIAVDPEPPAPIEPAPEPAPIAYRSGPSSLGVFELLANKWRRLEEGFEIAGPTRVISLPGYRNEFSLGAELVVEAVGLTDMKIDPPTDPGSVPQIELTHGRLLVSHAVAATAPAVIELVLDGVLHRIAFDPGAVVAIRADRLFQAGWPVEESSPPTVAYADTLAGTTEWTLGSETKRFRKSEGKLLSGELTESLVPQLGDNAWAQELPMSEFDRAAAEAMAKAIEANKPVWPQMRTIASQDRFKERRALAALASASLGHPDSLIESFTDSTLSDVWARNFAWLRQTASHDTAGAKVVRRVFEEKIGPQAAEGLMDLVVGYTQQEVGADTIELARGSLVSAVLPALESPDLATRVLGSLVLDELVTGAEGDYKPAHSDHRRAGYVRKIRNRLEDGKLEPRPR